MATISKRSQSAGPVRRPRTTELAPVTSAAEWRARHLRGAPSRILCDQELREFVDEHLRQMSLGKLRQACVERFGSARAPSQSGLYRYWIRTRNAGANVAAASSLETTVVRGLEQVRALAAALVAAAEEYEREVRAQPGLHEAQQGKSLEVKP